MGTISSSPCDAVNVDESPPAASEPWTAPAAPPSLCIVVTRTGWPYTLRRPADAHASIVSPIDVAGLIG